MKFYSLQQDNRLCIFHTRTFYVYCMPNCGSAYVLVIPHLRVVSTNIYLVAVVRSSPLAIANQSTVASYVCEVEWTDEVLK